MHTPPPPPPPVPLLKSHTFTEKKLLGNISCICVLYVWQKNLIEYATFTPFGTQYKTNNLQTSAESFKSSPTKTIKFVFKIEGGRWNCNQLRQFSGLDQSFKTPESKHLLNALTLADFISILNVLNLENAVCANEYWDAILNIFH